MVIAISTYKRVLSSLVLVCFFVTSESQMALAEARISAADSVRNPFTNATMHFKNMHIPDSLGRTMESFEGNSGKTVILIQDAHASIEAQRNIRRLIDYFEKQHGLTRVLVEGASKKLDAGLLRSFPDKERLREVLKFYEEKGELSGAVGAAIMGNQELNFEGMEDWRLYEDGLGYFLEAKSKTEKILSGIEADEKLLEQEKQKIYPAELLRADEILEKFQKEEIHLLDALTELAKIRMPEKESALRALLDQVANEGGPQINIPAEKFLPEFKAYTKQVKDSLIKTESQRELDRRTHQIELLKKLARLELGREEWEEIKTNSKLIGQFSSHLAFYENAEKRDEKFQKSVLRRLKDSESLIFIAGGFHTEAMTKHLKDRGISYAVVMPKINSADKSTAYEAEMHGEVSWKNYFRVENGRVDLAAAFLRAIRDKLLNVGATHRVAPTSIKFWRDQIIRDLSNRNEIEKSAKYTVYLDETTGNRESSEPKLISRIEKFIGELKNLETAHQLTEQNVFKLLKPSAMPAAAVTGALSDSISSQLLQYSPAAKLFAPRLTPGIARLDSRASTRRSEASTRAELRMDADTALYARINRGLSDADKRIRLRAMEELYRQKNVPEIMLPALLAAAKDEASGIRRLAVVILAEMAAKLEDENFTNAVKVLEDAMWDREKKVHGMAVQHLVQLYETRKLKNKEFVFSFLPQVAQEFSSEELAENLSQFVMVHLARNGIDEKKPFPQAKVFLHLNHGKENQVILHFKWDDTALFRFWQNDIREALRDLGFDLHSAKVWQAARKIEPDGIHIDLEPRSELRHQEPDAENKKIWEEDLAAIWLRRTYGKKSGDSAAFDETLSRALAMAHAAKKRDSIILVRFAVLPFVGLLAVGVVAGSLLRRGGILEHDMESLWHFALIHTALIATMRKMLTQSLQETETSETAELPTPKYSGRFIDRLVPHPENSLNRKVFLTALAGITGVGLFVYILYGLLTQFPFVGIGAFFIVFFGFLATTLPIHDFVDAKLHITERGRILKKEITEETNLSILDQNIRAIINAAENLGAEKVDEAYKQDDVKLLALILSKIILNLEIQRQAKVEIKKHPPTEQERLEIQAIRAKEEAESAVFDHELAERPELRRPNSDQSFNGDGGYGSDRRETALQEMLQWLKRPGTQRPFYFSSGFFSFWGQMSAPPTKNASNKLYAKIFRIKWNDAKNWLAGEFVQIAPSSARSELRAGAVAPALTRAQLAETLSLLGPDASIAEARLNFFRNLGNLLEIHRDLHGVTRQDLANYVSPHLVARRGKGHSGMVTHWVNKKFISLENAFVAAEFLLGDSYLADTLEKLLARMVGNPVFKNRSEEIFPFVTGKYKINNRAEESQKDQPLSARELKNLIQPLAPGQHPKENFLDNLKALMDVRGINQQEMADYVAPHVVREKGKGHAGMVSYWFSLRQISFAYARKAARLVLRDLYPDASPEQRVAILAGAPNMNPKEFETLFTARIGNDAKSLSSVSTPTRAPPGQRKTAPALSKGYLDEVLLPYETWTGASSARANFFRNFQTLSEKMREEFGITQQDLADYLSPHLERAHSGHIPHLLQNKRISYENAVGVAEFYLKKTYPDDSPKKLLLRMIGNPDVTKNQLREMFPVFAGRKSVAKHLRPGFRSELRHQSEEVTTNSWLTNPAGADWAKVGKSQQRLLIQLLLHSLGETPDGILAKPEIFRDTRLEFLGNQSLASLYDYYDARRKALGFPFSTMQYLFYETGFLFKEREEVEKRGQLAEKISIKQRELFTRVSREIDMPKWIQLFRTNQTGLFFLLASKYQEFDPDSLLRLLSEKFWGMDEEDENVPFVLNDLKNMESVLDKLWGDGRPAGEAGQNTLLTQIRMRIYNDIVTQAGKENGISAAQKAMEIFTRWMMERQKAGTTETVSQIYRKLIDYYQELKAADYQKHTHLRDADGHPVYLKLHQLEGIHFALKNQNVAVGDEMGVGKTPQTLATIEAADAERVVIVASKTLLEVWQKEIHRWLGKDQAVTVITGVAGKRVQNLREAKKASRFILINYEALRNPEIVKELNAWDPDYKIADEVHRLRNADTQEAEGYRALTAKRVMDLSGSTIVNDTQDLWVVLNDIAPKEFPSAAQFLRDYSRDALSFVRLNQVLYDRHFLRRTKADVSVGLPKKHDIEYVSIALDPAQQEVYSNELNDYYKIEGSIGKLAAQERMRQALIDLDMYYKTKGAFTHENPPKLREAIQLAKKIIASGEKLIIYSRYNHVIKRLQDMLAKEFGEGSISSINATQSPALRFDIVSDFQPNPAKKIFLSTYGIGGEGLTITAANHVIFIDLPPTKVQVDQAVARAHREGQTKEVFVYALIAFGTSDEENIHIINRKQSISERVNGRMLGMSEELKSAQEMDRKLREKSIIEKVRAALVIPYMHSLGGETAASQKDWESVAALYSQYVDRLAAFPIAQALYLYLMDLQKKGKIDLKTLKKWLFAPGGPSTDIRAMMTLLDRWKEHGVNPADLDLTEMDFSPAMLEQGRIELEKHGIRTTQRQANLVEDELPAAAFDFVDSSELWGFSTTEKNSHGVTHRNWALGQLVQSAKENGYLLLWSHNRKISVNARKFLEEKLGLELVERDIDNVEIQGLPREIKDQLSHFSFVLAKKIKTVPMTAEYLASLPPNGFEITKPVRPVNTFTLRTKIAEADTKIVPKPRDIAQFLSHIHSIVGVENSISTMTITQRDSRLKLLLVEMSELLRGPPPPDLIHKMNDIVAAMIKLRPSKQFLKPVQKLFEYQLKQRHAEEEAVRQAVGHAYQNLSAAILKAERQEAKYPYRKRSDKPTKEIKKPDATADDQPDAGAIRGPERIFSPILIRKSPLLNLFYKKGFRFRIFAFPVRQGIRLDSEQNIFYVDPYLFESDHFGDDEKVQVLELLIHLHFDAIYPRDKEEAAIAGLHLLRRKFEEIKSTNRDLKWLEILDPVQTDLFYFFFDLRKIENSAAGYNSFLARHRQNGVALAVSEKVFGSEGDIERMESDINSDLLQVSAPVSAVPSVSILQSAQAPEAEKELKYDLDFLTIPESMMPIDPKTKLPILLANWDVKAKDPILPTDPKFSEQFRFWFYVRHRDLTDIAFWNIHLPLFKQLEGQSFAKDFMRKLYLALFPGLREKILHAPSSITLEELKTEVWKESAYRSYEDRHVNYESNSAALNEWQSRSLPKDYSDVPISFSRFVAMHANRGLVSLSAAQGKILRDEFIEEHGAELQEKFPDITLKNLQVELRRDDRAGAIYPPQILIFNKERGDSLDNRFIARLGTGYQANNLQGQWYWNPDLFDSPLPDYDLEYLQWMILETGVKNPMKDWPIVAEQIHDSFIPVDFERTGRVFDNLYRILHKPLATHEAKRLAKNLAAAILPSFDPGVPDKQFRESLNEELKNETMAAIFERAVEKNKAKSAVAWKDFPMPEYTKSHLSLALAILHHHDISGADISDVEKKEIILDFLNEKGRIFLDRDYKLHELYLDIHETSAGKWTADIVESKTGQVVARLGNGYTPDNLRGHWHLNSDHKIPAREVKKASQASAESAAGADGKFFIPHLGTIPKFPTDNSDPDVKRVWKIMGSDPVAYDGRFVFWLFTRDTKFELLHEILKDKKISRAAKDLIRLIFIAAAPALAREILSGQDIDNKVLEKGIAEEQRLGQFGWEKNQEVKKSYPERVVDWNMEFNLKHRRKELKRGGPGAGFFLRRLRMASLMSFNGLNIGLDRASESDLRKDFAKEVTRSQFMTISRADLEIRYEKKFDGTTEYKEISMWRKSDGAELARLGHGHTLDSLAGYWYLNPKYFGPTAKPQVVSEFRLDTPAALPVFYIPNSYDPTPPAKDPNIIKIWKILEVPGHQKQDPPIVSYDKIFGWWLFHDPANLLGYEDRPLKKYEALLNILFDSTASKEAQDFVRILLIAAAPPLYREILNGGVDPKTLAEEIRKERKLMEFVDSLPDKDKNNRAESIKTWKQRLGFELMDIDASRVAAMISAFEFEIDVRKRKGLTPSGQEELAQDFYDKYGRRFDNVRSVKSLQIRETQEGDILRFSVWRKKDNVELARLGVFHTVDDLAGQWHLNSKYLKTGEAESNQDSENLKSFKTGLVEIQKYLKKLGIQIDPNSFKTEADIAKFIFNSSLRATEGSEAISDQRLLRPLRLPRRQAGVLAMTERTVGEDWDAIHRHLLDYADKKLQPDFPEPLRNYLQIIYAAAFPSLAPQIFSAPREIRLDQMAQAYHLEKGYSEFEKALTLAGKMESVTLDAGLEIVKRFIDSRERSVSRIAGIISRNGGFKVISPKDEQLLVEAFLEKRKDMSGGGLALYVEMRNSRIVIRNSDTQGDLVAVLGNGFLPGNIQGQWYVNPKYTQFFYQAADAGYADWDMKRMEAYLQDLGLPQDIYHPDFAKAFRNFLYLDQDWESKKNKLAEVLVAINPFPSEEFNRRKNILFAATMPDYFAHVTGGASLNAEELKREFDREFKIDQFTRSLGPSYFSFADFQEDAKKQGVEISPERLAAVFLWKFPSSAPMSLGGAAKMLTDSFVQTRMNLFSKASVEAFRAQLYSEQPKAKRGRKPKIENSKLPVPEMKIAITEINGAEPLATLGSGFTPDNLQGRWYLDWKRISFSFSEGKYALGQAFTPNAEQRILVPEKNIRDGGVIIRSEGAGIPPLLMIKNPSNKLQPDSVLIFNLEEFIEFDPAGKPFFGEIPLQNPQGPFYQVRQRRPFAFIDSYDKPIQIKRISMNLRHDGSIHIVQTEDPELPTAAYPAQFLPYVPPVVDYGLKKTEEQIIGKVLMQGKMRLPAASVELDLVGVSLRENFMKQKDINLWESVYLPLIELLEKGDTSPRAKQIAWAIFHALTPHLAPVAMYYRLHKDSKEEQTRIEKMIQGDLDNEKDIFIFESKIDSRKGKKSEPASLFPADDFWTNPVLSFPRERLMDFFLIGIRDSGRLSRIRYAGMLARAGVKEFDRRSKTWLLNDFAAENANELKPDLPLSRLRLNIIPASKFSVIQVMSEKEVMAYLGSGYNPDNLQGEWYLTDAAKVNPRPPKKESKELNAEERAKVDKQTIRDLFEKFEIDKYLNARSGQEIRKQFFKHEITPQLWLEFFEPLIQILNRDDRRSESGKLLLQPVYQLFDALFPRLSESIWNGDLIDEGSILREWIAEQKIQLFDDVNSPPTWHLDWGLDFERGANLRDLTKRVDQTSRVYPTLDMTRVASMLAKVHPNLRLDEESKKDLIAAYVEVANRKLEYENERFKVFKQKQEPLLNADDLEIKMFQEQRQYSAEEKPHPVSRAAIVHKSDQQVVAVLGNSFERKDLQAHWYDFPVITAVEDLGKIEAGHSVKFQKYKLSNGFILRDQMGDHGWLVIRKPDAHGWNRIEIYRLEETQSRKFKSYLPAGTIQELDRGEVQIGDYSIKMSHDDFKIELLPARAELRLNPLSSPGLTGGSNLVQMDSRFSATKTARLVRTDFAAIFGERGNDKISRTELRSVLISIISTLRGNEVAEAQLMDASRIVAKAGAENVARELRDWLDRRITSAAVYQKSFDPVMIENEIKMLVKNVRSFAPLRMTDNAELKGGYTLAYQVSGNPVDIADFVFAVKSLGQIDHILIPQGTKIPEPLLKLAKEARIRLRQDNLKRKNITFDGQQAAGLVLGNSNISLQPDSKFIPITSPDLVEVGDTNLSRFAIVLQTVLALLVASEIKDEASRKAILANPAALLKNYSLFSGFENAIISSDNNGLIIHAIALKAYFEARVQRALQTAA